MAARYLIPKDTVAEGAVVPEKVRLRDDGCRGQEGPLGEARGFEETHPGVRKGVFGLPKEAHRLAPRGQTGRQLLRGAGGQARVGRQGRRFHQVEPQAAQAPALVLEAVPQRRLLESQQAHLAAAEVVQPYVTHGIQRLPQPQNCEGVGLQARLRQLINPRIPLTDYQIIADKLGEKEGPPMQGGLDPRDLHRRPECQAGRQLFDHRWPQLPLQRHVTYESKYFTSTSSMQANSSASEIEATAAGIAPSSRFVAALSSRVRAAVHGAFHSNKCHCHESAPCLFSVW
eukprot:CAMPEP_0204148852 /NCGR_PEP_ID=MMETSP0361-20130328/23900_1 /ASSEMBLY_ACC=CAM_ASM_000343 /TAXON_ID=268821 /ORGANISM="Scrippsiella Hangoei, Strain SHTV-5" /LENGTH=285 /DNA_ID=CAMNT_0051103257 /DNA_START=27 /DNA_END=882 /DNA_ORIENTATION=+